MKSRLIFLLVATASRLAAAEPEAAPSMRSTLAAEIKKQVAYKPPAPKAAAANVTAPATANEETVVLEPFTVVAPTDAFAHKIEEQQQKAQAEKFSLTDGGTFLRIEGKTFTVEIKLKYDPVHGGWDLLSFSW
jgi:hypothetical protein